MIIYPPEMLPSSDDGDAAEVIGLSDADNALLAAMPFEMWTECEDGQACLRLARHGLCKHTRLNATLGRFERR